MLKPKQVATVKFNVEYTDTFGGEANYCWVKREQIVMRECAGRMAIMRKAKAAVWLNGVGGKTNWNGNDSATFRPYRMATVLFVNFADE